MPAKPSKSALKRQYLELQTLGEALIKLPDETLDAIPLDDDLRAAIRTASGMTSHGALRRQKQLIGKLMRSVDAEPIRQALSAATQTDRRASAVFHLAEKWRDRIVAEGRPALDAFPSADPGVKATLEALIDAISRSRTDADRRRLGRRVFRIVHPALNAKVHNDASSR